MTRDIETRGTPPIVTHGIRVAILSVLAAFWLGWHAARTEILFADGLRYIAQARQFERGDWSSAVSRSVDHPAYPLFVAAIHPLLAGDDSPEGWQRAAQAASVMAGVLLVLPLYLVALELFGRKSAWLGCLLAYLVPVTCHVFADSLSESTFLLAWTWGCWAVLKYLERPRTSWLLLSLALGAAAYFARPEGMLLPLALGATLALTTLSPRMRLPLRTLAMAGAVLGLGTLACVGPYLLVKGGLGTKPGVARVLGLQAPSAPSAVERERPADPDQSAWRTYLASANSVAAAIREAVTAPLLVLALLGVISRVRRASIIYRRRWVFLAMVGLGSALALLRLHATGGYCTPRHALILALPLLAASASGVRVVLAHLVQRRPHWRRAAILGPVMAAILVAALNARELGAANNEGAVGYREAGNWLARHSSALDRVVDVTGWAQFYGQREGYAFANLHEANSDPRARWVIVRDAHLKGPWPYCRALQALTADARLVARFPGDIREGRSRVSVYERSGPVAGAGTGDRR